MNKITIPTWITIFGWVLALFGIGIGLACYFAPDLVAKGIDMTSASGVHAMGSLGGRNLAMGVTLIVALLSKRAGLLMLGFIMRLVTEITDMYIYIKSDILGLPIYAILGVWIFCLIIPEILAIKKLKSMDA